MPLFPANFNPSPGLRVEGYLLDCWWPGEVVEQHFRKGYRIFFDDGDMKWLVRRNVRPMLRRAPVAPSFSSRPNAAAAAAAAAAASSEDGGANGGSGGGSGANGKVCAITGRPAKYKDPISGLPYADLAAFKELRKLHPDPKAAEKEAAKAAAEAAAKAATDAKEDGGGEGGEGSEGEAADDVIRPVAPVPSERPIQIGQGFARRVNKVA